MHCKYLSKKTEAGAANRQTGCGIINCGNEAVAEEETDRMPFGSFFGLRFAKKQKHIARSPFFVNTLRIYNFGQCYPENC